MNSFNHLLFRAGGLALAADSSTVHSVHDGLMVQAEDGTHDWFLGVAVADERLLPITDLGAFLHGSASFGRVLEVSRSLGIAGLKIDEVHGVSQNQPEPIDVDLHGNNGEPSLQALVINDSGQQYQLIDIAALLQSSRFLNLEFESVSA